MNKVRSLNIPRICGFFYGEYMSAETGFFWTLGAMGVTGKLLGMPVELLLIGGVIGAAMLGRHQETTRMNGIATILLSAVLAASLAPHVPKMFGWAQELDVFCAVVIAAAWPYIALQAWPLLKSAFQIWLGGGKK